MLVLNSIYNVLKKEYWPYRYYFLFIILCFITFKLDTITASRIIRFLIVCLVLILYKKIQNYLESISYLNLNNIKYWMWVHVIMNPVLYVIWKWDVYMYYKINEFMNNTIKNNKLKILIIIMVWNLSIPIKIIYLRFYMTLNVIKNINFYEFMFKRMYGFIISVLIFSDIMQYLLWLTGGYLYLMVKIYIILYIINVTYTIYYHFFKKIKNTVIYKIFKKCINFKLFKNLTIYKIGLNYINILKEIEINEVYKYRIVTTITGNYIKRHLNTKTIIGIEINKVPEIWRDVINNNRIYYDNFLYISYVDSENMSKISGLKIEHMLKIFFLNNNYKNFEKYHETYSYAISCLSDLFELYESVLVYKYYVYKRGAKRVWGAQDIDVKYIINIKEYEYIYKMYLLIIKNILYYIWSFEYYIYKDKNKLTKLHVIDDVYVDFGYHIYSKDKENFNQYDNFEWLVSENDFPNDKMILWNEKVDIVIEGQQILSRFILINNSNTLIYINAVQNKELKNIVLLLNKYIEKGKFDIFWHNPFMNLKEDIVKEYFQELKSEMDDLYKEWEINYMNQKNILEKQGEILLELIKHYNSKIKW